MVRQLLICGQVNSHFDILHPYLKAQVNQLRRNHGRNVRRLPQPDHGHLSKIHLRQVVFAPRHDCSNFGGRAVASVFGSGQVNFLGQVRSTSLVSSDQLFGQVRSTSKGSKSTLPVRRHWLKVDPTTPGTLDGRIVQPCKGQAASDLWSGQLCSAAPAKVAVTRWSGQVQSASSSCPYWIIRPICSAWPSTSLLL